MKISFIVPVYNCEATLKRCVDSILSQTNEDFELILINDGSSDSSLDICNSLKETNKRITVLSQENKGPSAARNYGISVACGDYIAFVDSDDYIEKNYIEKVLESAEKHNSDMIFMGYMFEDNHSGKILQTTGLPDNEYSKKDFPNIIYTLIDTDIFGYQWCKVVRRSIITDNQIMLDESVSLHEDLLFTCECCKAAQKISVISSPIYHYIKGIEGLCEKFRPDMLPLMDYVNERLFDFYREINLANLEKMILERAVFTYYLVLKNDRNETFKSIKKRKKQIKDFFCGVTTTEIEKHLNIYRTTIKGKKKWIYYILIKSKSLFIYYLISKKYK